MLFGKKCMASKFANLPGRATCHAFLTEQSHFVTTWRREKDIPIDWLPFRHISKPIYDRVITHFRLVRSYLETIYDLMVTAGLLE